MIAADEDRQESEVELPTIVALYLREIGELPLLKAEEEVAQRIEAGNHLWWATVRPRRRPRAGRRTGPRRWVGRSGPPRFSPGG
ncbi:MAG: sigma-70 factor domain-containing protein [Dehalococcoidia bacterium]|nr:sigma-70 factor domain-containing protein [Dehalococcoidia bacterium]